MRRPRPTKPKSVSNPTLPSCHLLDPTLEGYAQAVKHDAKIASYNGGVWTFEITETVHKLVLNWLKTGDYYELGRSCRQHIEVLMHPIVYRHIKHLRKLLHGIDGDDLRQRPDLQQDLDSPDHILTPGLKNAALQALKQLLTPVIEDIVPGWTVNFRARKQAPPRYPFADWMVAELQSLQEDLDHPENVELAEPSRRRDESRTEMIERVVILAQKLHLATPYAVVPVKSQGRMKKPSTKPLPSQVAMKIAQQAVGKKRLSHNMLLYSMCAYYWFKDPRCWKKVEGIYYRS